MNEVNVVLVDLPIGARGCVMPEADGSFTVYINAAYNHEQRRAIFEHEMRHLLLNHHYSSRSISQAENEASQPQALLNQIEYAARYGLPAAPLLPALPLPKSQAPVRPAAWLAGAAAALRDIRTHLGALNARG